MSKLLSICLALWWNMHSVSSDEQLILPPSQKRSKFLVEKLNTLQPASTQSSDDLTQKLGQYLSEEQRISFGAGSAFTAREFWKTSQAIYPKLSPVALDILAAPASQAYVDCRKTIFSLWIVVFRTQKSYDQGRVANPRPVATGRVSCACDWLRDATGLDSGDRSCICNTAQITDCESLFEDEYGHFTFTGCSVPDSEKEVNAKCPS